MPELIQTTALCKHYGKTSALRDVDLTLASGEILGFLGPNGAGKTTLIRVLLGFLQASSGSAKLFGLDTWQAGPRARRDVGYLPGDLRLYGSLDVKATLRLVERIRGTELIAHGLRIAERLGLPTGVPVRSMSRGTRQKLGIVLAFAHRPSVVILDEPATSLDPPTALQVESLVEETAHSGGAVLFSSHTLSEVERVSSRVAILRAGRVVRDVTLAELKNAAQRIAVVEWNTPPETLAPRGFEVFARDNCRWSLRFNGSARPLLEWLKAFDVADISVGPPDLEAVFRGHYDES